MITRAFLITSLLLLAGCGELRVIPEGQEGNAREAPIRVTGLRLRAYSASRQSQVIEAASAELFLDDQRATLEDLDMSFFEGDRVVTTVQADHGEASLAAEDFHAEGRTRRIRVTREDQSAVLYATQVSYEPREDRLFTDGEFTLVQVMEGGKAQIIRGVGLRTDRRLDRVEFGHPNIEQRNEIDLAAFEREVRPLTQENPS